MTVHLAALQFNMFDRQGRNYYVGVIPYFFE